MKTKTMVLSVTLVLAVSALAGLAIAGARGLHHDPAQMQKFITWKVNDTLDEIKATPEQRAKILAVKDRMLAEGKALHESHAALHEQVLGQWNADTIDRDQLNRLADQRIEEFRATVHRAVDGLVEVHDTLTPAQRQQVVNEFQKLHPRP